MTIFFANTWLPTLSLTTALPAEYNRLFIPPRPQPVSTIKPIVKRPSPLHHTFQQLRRSMLNPVWKKRLYRRGEPWRIGWKLRTDGGFRTIFRRWLLRICTARRSLGRAADLRWADAGVGRVVTQWHAQRRTRRSLYRSASFRAVYSVRGYGQRTRSRTWWVLVWGRTAEKGAGRWHCHHTGSFFWGTDIHGKSQVYGVHTGEGTPYENVRVANMLWNDEHHRYEFTPAHDADGPLITWTPENPATGDLPTHTGSNVPPLDQPTILVTPIPDGKTNTPRRRSLCPMSPILTIIFWSFRPIQAFSRYMFTSAREKHLILIDISTILPKIDHGRKW